MIRAILLELLHAAARPKASGSPVSWGAVMNS